MAKNWYKGNLHTHTNMSDGDTDPHKVVGWFRRHSYDFLVITDHDRLTRMDDGQGRRRYRKPLIIPGEEVSALACGGEPPIHINGIGISTQVERVDAGTVIATIQANVDGILKAGGIACLNHPNFHWAFNHEHIKQTNGARLMEIYNGFSVCNVYGGPGRYSSEEIWDGVLTTGKVIYGVAADDSHHYRDFHPYWANPGRGWVVVQALELTQEAIVGALAAGEFYASTGIIISELESTREAISLRIEQEWTQTFGNVREWDQVYTVDFIGSGGAALARCVGQEATYSIRGDEGYVRARVTGSSGVQAWTQPVLLR